MISLIAIFLYLATDLIYDYIGVGYNTNWSIFYFSMTNLSFTMIAFDIIYKETSKAISYTAVSMGLYFIVLIIMELRFINVPFDTYMLNVNSTSVITTACIVLSILLIFITVGLWEKRLSKK